MTSVYPLFKREFLGYFRSPIGYVFLGFFLVISMLIAFFFLGFYKAGQANLSSFFTPLPWLLLILAPSTGMGLWAEERRSGTLELLFTLPITPVQAVLAKFLAGWCFLTLGILLSFPLLLTCLYLGSPDLGIVFSSYLGAIFLAGGYLAVCALTSAVTKNQIVSFVLSFFVCFIIAFLGTSVFNTFLSGYLNLPVPLVDAISNFSTTTHYEAFTKGIIDPKDVVFFLSLAGFSLSLNVLAVER